MKLVEIGELHLAAIIAIATLAGGLATSLADSWLIDADVDRQTDVELVQLAISVLTKPREDAGMTPAGTGLTSERVLRRWSDFSKAYRSGDWTTIPEAKPFVR